MELELPLGVGEGPISHTEGFCPLYTCRPSAWFLFLMALYTAWPHNILLPTQICPVTPPCLEDSVCCRVALATSEDT